MKKFIPNNLPLLVLIMPYFYYFHFIFRYLRPLEYPDAFAYVWRAPFNIYYLIGRSLTQRIIFTLVGNNPYLIILIQLLFYLITAILIYYLCTTQEGLIYKWVAVFLISFFFLSYSFNIISVIINSEPLFHALLIAFPFLLFLANEDRYLFALTLISLTFIFSKNVAPFLFLFLLLVRLVLLPRGMKGAKQWLIFSFLSITAISRIIITILYDTSVQINTLNNIYNRVFTEQSKVEHFAKKYNMPTGSFVTKCRGQNVLVPCLGFSTLHVNPKTRNYELRGEKRGFIRWVKKEGQKAYLSYLIIDTPLITAQVYRKAYNDFFTIESVQFMINYMGLKFPDFNTSNLETLHKIEKPIGFLGFDPLTLLYYPLLMLGFNRLEMVFLYSLIGFYLYKKFPNLKYIPLALGMLTGSCFLFFLTFFGDAMEIVRHIFPSYLLLIMGGFFYLISLLEFICAVIRTSIVSKILSSNQSVS